MSNDGANVIMKRRYGTRQQDRYLPALSPDSVPIDGKSLPDDLDFAYDFSGLVNFYNTSDLVSGNWKLMLMGDLSITLSSILSVDLTHFPAQKDALENAYAAAVTEGEAEQVVSELFELDVELGFILADWVIRIGKVQNDPLNTYGIISENIQTYLRFNLPRMGWALREMTLGFDVSPINRTQKNLFADVNFILTSLNTILPDTAELVLGEQETFDSIDSQYSYLKNLFDSLYRAVWQIQKILTEKFEESLQEPNHQPHSGLLIAFQEMMAQAKNSLNAYAEKYLNFYYEDVLQLGLLPAIPDQALIQFTLKPSITSSLVPEGTLLVGGTAPSGAKVLYATDRDFFPNQATISQIKSIFNCGASAEYPGEYLLYSAPIANSGDGNGGKFPKGVNNWPPFGENQGTTNTTMQTAAVGLAFSDPVLVMSDGTRTLNVYIELSEDQYNQLWANLLPLGLDAETFPQVFNKFLKKAFTLSYTGPKGWVDISYTQELTLFSPTTPPDSPLPNDRQGIYGFWFSVSLKSTGLAVTEYSAAIHGPGYQGTFPVFRMMLDQSQSVDTHVIDPVTQEAQFITITPYNLLREVLFTQVTFKVEVQGKKELSFQNDTAVLNAKKPFSPFVTQALEGANFYIGSSEAFQKDLSSLSISVNWANLPKDTNGFGGYYSIWNEVDPEYPFYNSVFRVELGLLNELEFQPLSPVNPNSNEPPVTDFPLFAWDRASLEEAEANEDPSVLHGDTSDEPYQWLLLNLQSYDEDLAVDLIGTSSYADEGKLQPLTTWTNFDFTNIDLNFASTPAASLPKGFAYSPDAVSGFLRISLSAPAYGFGSGLYQQTIFEVNKVNIENLGVSMIAPPKPPFSPQIKSLTLDYVASGSLAPGQTDQIGSVYVIEPFGIAASPVTENQYALLPNYSQEGNLFLGIENFTAPQNLTLLVQVDESSARSESVEPPQVEWSYLENGAWVPFNTPDIFEDSTVGFLKLGIIGFTIDNGPSDDGGMFESVANADELLWLRGSIKNNSKAVCNVVSISTQAVSATWQVTEDAADNLAHFDVPLPAGTIKSMQTPLPDISKVAQPFAAFGGQAPEQQSTYYQRVNERLRHKWRAITPWDIERIVLQQFPNVWLANCLSHTDKENEHTPGASSLVVLPSPVSANQETPLRPHLNRIGLEEISTFFNDLRNENLNLIVRNPEYEFLRIVATVTFQAGDAPGYYLQQLNSELCAMISPWTEEPAEYNPFQSMVSRALIQEFILGRSYVATLEELQIHHYINVDGTLKYFPLPGEFDYFVPRNSWGILTSAEQHYLLETDSNVSLGPDKPLGLYVAADTQKSPGVGELVVTPVKKPGKKGEHEDKVEYLFIRMR